MKLKIKTFLLKHWICCWGILSILFAIIIHFLFCLTSQNKYLTAKWGAGDILTYTSTVALGLLAMWQNKKQQEENDIAQSRLENISMRSNELNVINKIIEHETNRIQSLQKAMDNFTNACDPQTIALASAKDGVNNMPSEVGLTELEKRIDAAFFEVSRLLREDHEDRQSFNEIFAKMYKYAKENVTNLRDGRFDFYNQKAIADIVETLAKYRDIFLHEREQYLIKQEKNLSRILFEDLSLEEIRAIYNKRVDK